MPTSSAIDRRRALGLLVVGALGLDRLVGSARGASPPDDPPAKGSSEASRPAVDPATVDRIDIAGRPDAKTLGDDTRLVLWRDLKEGNIHVQAVARGAPKTFRGTIVAVGGAIRDVEGLESLESAKKSKKGAVKNATTADRVQWKKDTLDFRFHTLGGRSEAITIRITPETTHLKLTFLIDGKAAHDRIFLGKAGTHPARDIVVVPLGR
jgi:hypothetical protein